MVDWIGLSVCLTGDKLSRAQNAKWIEEIRKDQSTQRSIWCIYIIFYLDIYVHICFNTVVLVMQWIGNDMIHDIPAASYRLCVQPRVLMDCHQWLWGVHFDLFTTEFDHLYAAKNEALTTYLARDLDLVFDYSGHCLGTNHTNNTYEETVREALGDACERLGNVVQMQWLRCSHSNPHHHTIKIIDIIHMIHHNYIMCCQSWWII